MSTLFYYLEADEKTVRGPFEATEIRSLQQRGILGVNAQVCVAGSDDWRRLNAYPEFGSKLPMQTPATRSLAKRDLTPTQITFVCILACVAFGGFWAYHEVPSLHQELAAHHYVIWVRGTPGLHFQGNVGVQGNRRSVDGIVPTDYEFSGHVCVAVIQKIQAEGSLDVSIISDNEREANNVTTARYGSLTLTTR